MLQQLDAYRLMGWTKEELIHFYELDVKRLTEQRQVLELQAQQAGNVIGQATQGFDAHAQFTAPCDVHRRDVSQYYSPCHHSNELLLEMKKEIESLKLTLTEAMTHNMEIMKDFFRQELQAIELHVNKLQGAKLDEVEHRQNQIPSRHDGPDQRPAMATGCNNIHTQPSVSPGPEPGPTSSNTDWCFPPSRPRIIKAVERQEHVLSRQLNRYVIDNQPNPTVPNVEDNQPNPTVPNIGYNKTKPKVPNVENIKANPMIPNVEDIHTNLTVANVKDTHANATVPFTFLGPIAEHIAFQMSRESKDIQSNTLVSSSSLTSHTNQTDRRAYVGNSISRQHKLTPPGVNPTANKGFRFKINDTAKFFKSKQPILSDYRHTQDKSCIVRLQFLVNVKGALQIKLLVSSSPQNPRPQQTLPLALSGHVMVHHAESKKHTRLWSITSVICDQPKYSEEAVLDGDVCLITTRSRDCDVTYELLQSKRYIKDDTLKFVWSVWTDQSS